MINATAKDALHMVIKLLDTKADQVAEMINEARFDQQDTFTVETAVSYLNDIIAELSTEIGHVVEQSLKEVLPSQEPEPVV